MMIKAVIFDFFGVICSDEFWNFVKEEQNSGGKFTQLSADVNLGTITWEAFVQQVATETGRPAEEVKAQYAAQKIHLELVAYIGALHSNFKTALISNASTDQIMPMIKEVHLDKVFDELVISSEVGFSKPDPRIFKYALDKLQVEPEEAVFIDDISSYVDAAATLGLKTIHYQNFIQMKKELEPMLKPAPSDN